MIEREFGSDKESETESDRWGVTQRVADTVTERDRESDRGKRESETSFPHTTRRPPPGKEMVCPKVLTQRGSVLLIRGWKKGRPSCNNSQLSVLIFCGSEFTQT